MCVIHSGNSWSAVKNDVVKRNSNQSWTNNEEETTVEKGNRAAAFKGCIELMTMVLFASGATRKRISASRRWARRRWLREIVAPADNWDKPPSLDHRRGLPTENGRANTITNGSQDPNDGVISFLFLLFFSHLRLTTGNWCVCGRRTTWNDPSTWKEPFFLAWPKINGRIVVKSFSNFGDFEKNFIFGVSRQVHIRYFLPLSEILASAKVFVRIL